MTSCVSIACKTNEVMPAVKTMPAGKVLLNEPLARYTSWRVGGAAEQYYRPTDIDDLSVFISQLDSHQAIFWLGGGSNLLIRDGGIAGTVIHLRRSLDEIRLEADGRVYVEAGVGCPQVARFCQKNGLSGASFLVGIPGTIGGALTMNAGAFGGETWQLVSEVELMDHQGHRQWLQSSSIQVGYRKAEVPQGHCFVATRLALSATDNDDHTNMQELLERRRRSQPINIPTCGSVFKNPQDGYAAAQLIEQCGLKGHQIGQARVSEKHANFIENTGGASAADIELLIHLIQDSVEREHNIRLETEVRIVGEPLSQNQ